MIVSNFWTQSILQPWLPKYWGYKCTLPYLAKDNYFEENFQKILSEYRNRVCVLDTCPGAQPDLSNLLLLKLKDNAANILNSEEM